MLDHDSRDAFSIYLRGGRVEAPHLAPFLCAAVGENRHRPRVAALHPEGEPPVQRRPLRVADEPRRESTLRQFRRN